MMPQDSEPSESGSSDSETGSESESESELSSDIGSVAVRQVDKKGLKSAQLENEKLRKELKKLKLMVNSGLTEAKNVNPRHRSKAVVSEKLSVYDRDISLSGRKYSLMIAPWVDASILSNVVGRPDVDPRGNARFDKKNKKGMQDGALAELYEFLPVTLYDPLQNHPKFSSTFRHHLQNTRSNAVLAVRQKAGLIFGLDQAYFETTFDRAAVPELERLLKNSQNEYATLAPILFPDGVYDSTKMTLFRNIVLPRIIKTILCGRSSTTSSRSISKPQTLAELWGVTNVTPGLIAFSAILARYMLSPDEELRRTGGKTGIAWNQEFLEYKKLLVVKSKKTSDLFKYFDEIVFGSSGKGTVPDLESDVDAQEMEDALQAFMDDDDDVPSSLLGGLTITPNEDLDTPLGPSIRDSSAAVTPSSSVTPSAARSPPAPITITPSAGVATVDGESDVLDSERDQRKGTVNESDANEDTRPVISRSQSEKSKTVKTKRASPARTIEDDVDVIEEVISKPQSEKSKSIKTKKASPARTVDDELEVNEDTLPAVSKPLSKSQKSKNLVTRKASSARTVDIVDDGSVNEDAQSAISETDNSKSKKKKDASDKVASKSTRKSRRNISVEE